MKELKEKIDRINKQRKYESENFPQETLEYDIKISNYNESINDITAKNNVLFAQLTKLQKRINLIFDINIKKSMKKESSYSSITANNEKPEPTLDELNAMKDKQKESMNKLIEVYKKDISKLKSQLESSEDYAERIEQLEHNLSEKNTKIEKLQNSIAALSKVKDIHMKSCTKVHDRLIEQLTAVKNEHLFIKESIYKEEQLKAKNEEIKAKPRTRGKTLERSQVWLCISKNTTTDISYLEMAEECYDHYKKIYENDPENEKIKNVEETLIDRVESSTLDNINNAKCTTYISNNILL